MRWGLRYYFVHIYQGCVIRSYPKRRSRREDASLTTCSRYCRKHSSESTSSLQEDSTPQRCGITMDFLFIDLPVSHCPAKMDPRPHSGRLAFVPMVTQQVQANKESRSAKWPLKHGGVLMSSSFSDATTIALPSVLLFRCCIPWYVVRAGLVRARRTR